MAMSVAMKRIITDQDERIGAWVAASIGRAAPWGPFHALGIEQDGILIAGVVFDGWVKEARCSMHCAGIGKRWLTREFLFACFDYAFRQLNCKVIINPVDADNEASIKFTSHIGFAEVARIPEGSGDCDLIIFAMPRRTCRWLSVRRG